LEVKIYGINRRVQQDRTATTTEKNLSSEIALLAGLAVPTTRSGPQGSTGDWFNQRKKSGLHTPRYAPLALSDLSNTRDVENINALAAQGWASLVVWECETSDVSVLSRRIRQFIEGDPKGGG
jgi:hypothetical protein